MKLVLHIVGKDLRRLRWWLLAWVVVLALPILTGGAMLARNPFAHEGWYQGWDLPKLHERLVALEIFVAYLLTLVLLQEDTLLGTRQFWLTRPISRGRLLGAKALGAMIVLWLLPVAISLPWWWWCGFGAGEMIVAAWELCVVATLIALPAALHAVITDSLARALLWTMAFVAAVPVTMLFFGAASISHNSPLWISRAVLAVSLVALEFALIVVIQFYVRNNGRWLTVAGGVILVTLAAASQSRWVFIGRTEPAELNPTAAAGVEVKFQGASAGPWAKHVAKADGLDVWHWVGTRFTASGLPPGTILSGAGAAQLWRFGDAFETKSSDYLQGGAGNSVRIGGLKELRLRELSEDEETRRWMAVWRARNKQAPMPALLPPGEAELRTEAYLRPSLVARMRTAPPRYEARLWMELMRPELALEAPFAAGDWRTGAGRGLRIERIYSSGGPRPQNENSRHAVTLMQLVEARPASLLEMLRLQVENHVWFSQPWRRERETYVALNRGRGEFIWLGGNSSDDKSVELVVSGVRVQWLSMNVALPHVVRDDKWMPVPEWSSGVTIGRIFGRTTATFARDVVVEQFEFSQEQK